MSKANLDPEDWSLIEERIREGFCVPFLGAGANAIGGRYTMGLPLGGEVSLRLLGMWMDLKDDDLKAKTKLLTHEKLMNSPRYSDLTRISIQNLARVSLHIEFRHDYTRLIKYLRSILPEDKAEPSPLLDMLARLPAPKEPTSPPFQLIVTTNYDNLMERALQARGKDYRCVVQPIEGFKPASLKRLEDELAEYQGTVVYKIHGSFAKQDGKDASSIIITEEDYIRFLLTVVKDRQGIPNLIKGKLVDSTLLFLGYSLEDWDFRTLFKGLIETLPPRNQRRSFAIQRYPTGFWIDFWDKKGIEIRDVDLYEFAEDLGLVLGLEEEPYLEALREELGRGAIEMVSGRRAVKLDWEAYARSLVAGAGDEPAWSDFLGRRLPGRIPPDAPGGAGGK